MKTQNSNRYGALGFNSIENIPSLQAQAIFHVDSSSVFREDTDIMPVQISDRLSYIPWGADNQMPFHILKLVEDDETLATCQQFNAEVCYGSGIHYDTCVCTQEVRDAIENFQLENDIASYFLGACTDFKFFGFCVSVIILDREGKRIVNLLRKEACYCRFAPMDSSGRIPKVLYANWRKSIAEEKDVEQIELLDMHTPWRDLAVRMGRIAGDDGKCSVRTKCRKFAVVSRIPTPDSTYYPITYYASLFRSKWYNIKQLIGTAKEAKLKNSAPIKYHIEISMKYWDSIFKREGITDRREQQERVVQEKQQILDFLTGAENSGKVWFSAFYVNPNGEEQHDVKITSIDGATKEGGDWSTDIQEAVNMICFTMRVHSNLVGSVPGKSQMNNSGSDKRELYTIAQASQKAYHDLLFTVHRILIKYNAWAGARVECPFVQLTTLDEHKDAKLVSTEPNA